MATVEGARERARGQVSEEIKAEARRQLADSGAAKLSLRAVARALGLVSSAIYRYYPNRDELLTALITDAYDALGAAAEQALAGAESEGAGPAQRWLAVCRAVRTWALHHPHEYALLYGSPVPGYHAPESTARAAGRVAFALLAVVREAHREGGELPPGAAELPTVVRADAVRLGELLEVDVAPELVAALIAAWAQLFGLVGFEVFGQFRGVVEARSEFFDHAAARLGAEAGISPS